jgi:hypothetical protein
MNSTTLSDITKLPPRAAFRFAQDSSASPPRPRRASFRTRSLLRRGAYGKSPLPCPDRRRRFFPDRPTWTTTRRGPSGWMEAPGPHGPQRKPSPPTLPWTPRILRAFHVAQWRTESAYCGRCGHPQRRREGRAGPALPQMRQARVRPHLSAVIVLVHTGRRQGAPWRTMRNSGKASTVWWRVS